MASIWEYSVLYASAVCVNKIEQSTKGKRLQRRPQSIAPNAWDQCKCSSGSDNKLYKNEWNTSDLDRSILANNLSKYTPCICFVCPFCERSMTAADSFIFSAHIYFAQLHSDTVHDIANTRQNHHHINRKTNCIKFSSRIKKRKKCSMEMCASR